MDRVRALIGSRRRNAGGRQGPGTAANARIPEVQRAEPAMQFASSDDQETIFETLNDAQTLGPGRDEDGDNDDTQTLRTYLSENPTIGDMQRQGYVNRSPQFCSVRDVCFVSVLLTKGFFAFPSKQSYDVYIANKRRLDRVDPLTGMGVPLFHAVPTNIMKSIFSNKTQTVLKIHKYELAKRGAPLPGSAQIVHEAQEFVIAKYLFCTVTMEEVQHTASSPAAALNQESKIKHTLKFHNTDGSYTTTEMFNINGRRDIDTSLDTLPLRWFGFSSFASPFGSNDIKLLILDDNMPNLVESTPNTGSVPRPLGYLPVWAKYTDVDDSFLSTKRSVYLANLEIKETTDATARENLGILNVPWNTQVLTCMCMLLHDYESRKERRHIHPESAAAYVTAPQYS